MFQPLLPQLRTAASAFALAAIFVLSSCSQATRATANRAPTAEDRATININTADASTLETLPHIGPAVARKIVEHRNRYGPFRRTEHILVIDGIGASRFREIERFVSIE